MKSKILTLLILVSILVIAGCVNEKAGKSGKEKGEDQLNGNINYANRINYTDLNFTRDIEEIDELLKELEELNDSFGFYVNGS